MVLCPSAMKMSARCVAAWERWPLAGETPALPGKAFHAPVAPHGGVEGWYENAPTALLVHGDTYFHLRWRPVGASGAAVKGLNI